MSDAHEQDIEETEPRFDEGADADLAAEVENLRAEKQALYEQLARVQADYQNSQRRLEKDMNQRLAVAAGQLIKAFLPVLDNLERAKDVPPTATLESVLNGVRGTYEQWLDVLKKNGVSVLAPAAGTPFDPSQMEALMQEPADYDTPTVTRLLARGYVFDGRTLRPAQVAVSQSK